MSPIYGFDDNCTPLTEEVPPMAKRIKPEDPSTTTKPPKKPRDEVLRGCFDITPLESGHENIVCKYCTMYNKTVMKFNSTKARSHLVNSCQGIDEDLKQILAETSQTQQNARKDQASAAPNGQAPPLPSIARFRKEDVISVNQRLLNAIAARDFDTYNELCADDITAFEPESRGMLVQGLEFHKYYFDLFGHPSILEKEDRQPIIPNTITMSNPHVRWLGSANGADGDGLAAVISYVRLDQTMTAGDKGPTTKMMSETRIWEHRGGTWINVHFHKS